MLSEDVFAAVCGAPLSSNTAIAKDVNIYHQTLRPSYGVRATFRKSATPPGGLAVSDAHVFAAQQDKAYVHVYSRLRGGQECFVSVDDKVRCVALAGNVLVIGTAGGKLLLWETLSGRLVSTPPCHVQAVTCLATTPYHVLSGSEDSNVHVWSLPQLLARGGGAGGGGAADFDQADELEPERTLARHRAAVTGVAVGGGAASRDTNLCVTAGRDKTVVLWNYQTGVALRTLLFPATPICLVLDPVARALYAATEPDKEEDASGGSLFAVELSGEKPLLGARGEAASTAASITTPFGRVPAEAGLAHCLAVSYDGATLLSGHANGLLLQWSLGDAASAGGPGSALPVELANLNAAVTNVVFVPPPALAGKTTTSRTSVQTVVKPSQMARSYGVTVQFDETAAPIRAPSSEVHQKEAAFDALLHSVGFPGEALEQALLSLSQPAASHSQSQDQAADGSNDGDAELRRQNAELLEIVEAQRALLKQTKQHYANPKAARS